jgi:hypothetical protein
MKYSHRGDCSVNVAFAGTRLPNHRNEAKWAPMNADQRRWRAVEALSAFIRVHRRPDSGAPFIAQRAAKSISGSVLQFFHLCGQIHSTQCSKLGDEQGATAFAKVPLGLIDSPTKAIMAPLDVAAGATSRWSRARG